MRIAVACSSPEVVGGAERSVSSVLPALLARGHELLVVHERPLGAIPERGGPRPVVTPPGVASVCSGTLGRKETIAAVRAFGAQVVYEHGLVDDGLEGALVESFPTIGFRHAYQGTCVSGTKRFAFPTLRPCDRRFGLACLACYLPRRCGGTNPLTALSLYREQARRLELSKRHTRILVASRHMAREHERHGVPTALLPYFPPDREPDAALRPAAPRGAVLLLGRLVPDKGGSVLVEALALAAARLGRPLELVVAGAGPDREAIEARALARGVPVRFEGWVEGARLDALLRGVELLAVPSLWPEPFGLVGVEAGCVGLPAVAFAVGGIPEWLGAGVTGELAPGDPPSAEGLARAIERAIGSPEHYALLRQGALSMSRRFSRDAHLEALETHLREAAGA